MTPPVNLPLACLALWPLFLAAADESGLPPETVAAIAWNESGCLREVDGPGVSDPHPYLGPGMMSKHWFRGAQAAGYHWTEWTSEWGVLAMGQALHLTRLRWQPRSDEILICIWAVGIRARHYRRDCTYSRIIRRTVEGWK